jgi:Bacterial PH domain
VTRQPLRQRSPLALAAVCAATGLFLLVSVALDWADNPQPLFASWVVFGLALVWSVFVRPAVLLDPDGVTLRNIVREVHIPWGLVSETESRWNLKVLAGDRGYTAWAISSQVERPRALSAGLLGGFSHGGPRGYAQAGDGASTRAPSVTAATVAQAIEAARQEYDEAVAQGAFPAAPGARVRITWAPLVVAVLLLPAVAIVALSLA